MPFPMEARCPDMIQGRGAADGLALTKQGVCQPFPGGSPASL